MRNIFLRLRERGTVVIMLLLLSVVVASCGKDDNIIIGANMMNVNGTEMIMGEATFVEYGPMGSGINCDVAIFRKICFTMFITLKLMAMAYLSILSLLLLRVRN